VVGAGTGVVVGTVTGAVTGAVVGAVVVVQARRKHFKSERPCSLRLCPCGTMYV
jgi:hypothetical protein